MHLRRDTNFTKFFLYPTWILKYLYFHQLLNWHFQVTLQSHDVLVKNSSDMASKKKLVSFSRVIPGFQVFV